MKKRKLKNKGSLKKLPGTIVYTGEKIGTEKINIEHYIYNDNEFIVRRESRIEDIKIDKNYRNWVNLDGIHNPEMLKKIGEHFNIDAFVLEDIANVSQRPKLDERDDYIFLVVKMVEVAENSNIKYEQVSLIISEDYVISFQEDPGDVFNVIRERIELGVGRIRKKKHDYLAYSLLDAIIDNYFTVVETIEEKVDTLEDKLINSSTRQDLIDIINLKHEIMFAKRAMIPIREVMAKLSHSRELNLFKEDMYLNMNDLYDHAVHLHDLVENLASRITDLLSIYHSTIGSIMNETMRVLTIVSTIFVPLTFIAGVYGMNFENMPELSWKYGYFGAIFIMFLLGFAMYKWFKGNDWI